MEIRPARQSERDEVLDLLALWYGDREFFARYNQNDPQFRDDFCLVACDGGRIVSTVQIFDRSVNLEGQAVPMGGIGSVFTREEYRHKGIASALMRLAIETMTREGFEVSLLFAERLGFYRRFGWREIERKFTILADAARLNAHGEFLIDVFDADRDLAETAAVHRAYSGRFNATATRDDAAWRANLKFAGNQPEPMGGGSNEYFILCRRAEQITAYARIAPFHGISMVMEFGHLPGAIGAMLAAFRHLGESAAGLPLSYATRGDHRSAALLRNGAAASSSGVLVTHTAHDPDLEALLAAAGCPVTHHLDNNYMWRVLSPDKLAARFGVEPNAAAEHAMAIFTDPRSLYWTADRF
jgi:predicted N-acetyltransferase YhbS